MKPEYLLPLVIVCSSCLKGVGDEEDRAPVAEFTVSPSTIVYKNDEVEFVNQSVNANSYYWDFGDGEYSEEASPKHVFSSYGEYSVVLKARNDFSETVKKENITVTSKVVEVKTKSAFCTVEKGSFYQQGNTYTYKYSIRTSKSYVGYTKVNYWGTKVGKSTYFYERAYSDMPNASSTTVIYSANSSSTYEVTAYASYGGTMDMDVKGATLTVRCQY